MIQVDPKTKENPFPFGHVLFSLLKNSNWRNTTLSPLSKHSTASFWMFIFKCWVNICVGNFIVKRKSWKHEKPIVLQWKCTKLYFTNCPSQSPQLWRHSWLELRAGVIRWDARDAAEMWGLLSRPVVSGPGPAWSWECLPAMSHTLVITGQRKPISYWSSVSVWPAWGCRCAGKYY